MTMGGRSSAPEPKQVAVISPQFCMNYPVDLTVERKHLNFVQNIMTRSEGNSLVTDVYGDKMFTVKGELLSPCDRRVLYDSDRRPLITLHQKILSAHRRWAAFKGDSTDSKDLLFSVKKSSFLQTKTKLHVFLDSNPDEDSCDFRIEGSWSERSCTIYAGNSSDIIIAQMHKQHGAQGIPLGKHTFGVTVRPNVDCAFIVALFVILEGLKGDRFGED